MEMSTPRLQQKQACLGWVHCILVHKQFANVWYKSSEVFCGLICMSFNRILSPVILLCESGTQVWASRGEKLSALGKDTWY